MTCIGAWLYPVLGVSAIWIQACLMQEVDLRAQCADSFVGQQCCALNIGVTILLCFERFRDYVLIGGCLFANLILFVWWIHFGKK